MPVAHKEKCRTSDQPQQVVRKQRGRDGTVECNTVDDLKFSNVALPKLAAGVATLSDEQTLSVDGRFPFGTETCLLFARPGRLGASVANIC